LIYGLDQEPSVELSLEVPSRLLETLRQHHADVALLPVIDYQRMEGLRIVPAGGIASDNTTLTVRIFSDRPIEKIDSLGCDPDSHTSIALARIILAERYNIHPVFTPLKESPAKLLIGDKVICEQPAHLPYQIDLGEQWRALTGLPFVFAVWMARPGVDLGDLPTLLERAKRRGLAHVEDLVRHHALPRGWPAETAREYLTRNLKYDIGPQELLAIRRFHHLAHQHGLIESVRELVLA
jgi:chorismate dehydratase